MTAHEEEPLDFWLSIDARDDGAHDIVARSPAGNGRATVRLDSVVAEAETIAATLNTDWRGLKRGGGTSGPQVREDFEVRLERTGRQLFNAIMVDGVGDRYRRCYDRANDRKTGLRVRLQIQAPKLAALPWEYLFDSVNEHFVARTSLTSVVRYVDVDRKAELLQIDLPLRVLGVLSGPADQAPLSKDTERSLIEGALAEFVADGRVILHWATDGTFSEFAQALRQHKPHIVHFIGHGEFDVRQDEGIVLFEDDQGASRPIEAGTLGALLLGHPSVRLMVLNSCDGARSGTNLFSSTAGTLVRRGVPAVIAMQYAITDQAALRFSEELYRGLADFDPVDKAVSAARLQMYAADPGSPEWGTPVLFLQSETGALFDLRRPDATPQYGAVITPGGTPGTSGGVAVVVPPTWWRRAIRAIPGFLKATKTIVGTAVVVLVGLGKGYFTAREERARAVTELDTTFAAIRKDTSAGGRMLAFNNLRGRELPGMLEPYAIRKIIELVRDENRVGGSCSASATSRTAQVSDAFDVMRHFQRQVNRERQFSERAWNAFISAMAENPARPLSRIVLDSVDLRRADLRHLALDSASFRIACLRGARFDSSSLTAAVFDSARLEAASFVDVSGRRMRLHKAVLRGADFSGATLTNADFFGAEAHCAIFIGATLDSARFEYTKAPWSSFEGAGLMGVRRWDEASDLKDAMFANPRAGPDDPVVVSAIRRGAALLDVDRRRWIDGRLQAMRSNGVCAVDQPRTVPR
jgi:uncharacterized protein YjbI with pentapeptide repeats